MTEPTANRYAVNPATLDAIKTALELLPKEHPDLVCDGCARIMEVEVTDLKYEGWPPNEKPRWRITGFQRIEKGWFSGSFEGSPGRRVCYCPNCASSRVK